MKTFVCAAVAALFLSLAAAGALWSASRARESVAAEREARRAEAFQREIAALRQEREALEARVKALETARTANDSPKKPRGGGPEGGTDATRAVAEGTGRVMPAGAGGDGAPPTPEEKLDRALEVLLDPGKSWAEKHRTWKDLADAGLLDRAIETFERRAKENPGNADAQAQAGVAYLQKLNTVMSEVEKGTWATKADGAFDAALAVDDHHWEARFTKAMSLSFWPPVFGKQGEAIRQFETLRAQQEELPAEAKFAETYLLLGNMYQNRGETAKAAGIWKDGAQRFPGNKELTSRAGEEEEEAK
jgi:tetratricopeptide (TPR) repeat protein